ncbi:MAG: hypothetical protein WDN44_06205 [Sphingomonas sp.]
MTDIAVTSPVERIARVIAAEALSANGAGGGVSAQVDSSWRDELPRALAVLRTLREATPEMVEAGRAAGGSPAEIWAAMVHRGDRAGCRRTDGLIFPASRHAAMGRRCTAPADPLQFADAQPRALRAARSGARRPRLFVRAHGL